MPELLPATGVATIRQIAETLEITDSRFAEMWPRLPLDDAAIAGLLNLTRQQVINLRKSARERLARRLKVFFDDAVDSGNKTPVSATYAGKAES